MALKPHGLATLVATLAVLGCASGRTVSDAGQGATGGAAGVGGSSAAGLGGLGGGAGRGELGGAGGVAVGGAGTGGPAGSSAGGGGAGGATGRGGTAGSSVAGRGGAAGTTGGGGVSGRGGAAGSGGASAGAGGAAGGLAAAPVWDWVSVIGTGQSLSVGGHGNTPATAMGSTQQRFHNLKLSLGTAKVPPWDATNGALSMVPLVEPLRTITTAYPSPYPANIYGESFHTAMADEITSRSMAANGRDYLTVQTEVGEAGQPISIIQKGATDTGTTGRAYAASLFEVGATARLANKAGKSYGVGAIVLTHGESDAASTTFEADMVKLWSDYNQDLRGLTAQTFSIPMLLSQQHSSPSSGTSAGTLAQWRIGVDHPGDIVCSGPKYQYAYVADNTHLTNPDYERLGEKYGQVFFERVVRGNDWQPLQPTAVEHSGRVVTVHFHVPVGPLAWDAGLPAPHQSTNTEWAQGRGFEVRSGSTRIPIASVAIAGDAVQITCSADLPSSGVTVGYASTADGTPRSGGTWRWGLLHDSDPFVGSLTGVAQPNWCVAFELPVP